MESLSRGHSGDDKGAGRNRLGAEADGFGKSVFKKLCAVRSARDGSSATLQALLEHDKDGVSKCPSGFATRAG